LEWLLRNGEGSSPGFRVLSPTNAAIVRQLSANCFAGQYRLTSKSDDDLPVCD
jgi:hypothetical protein